MAKQCLCLFSLSMENRTPKTFYLAAETEYKAQESQTQCSCLFFSLSMAAQGDGMKGQRNLKGRCLSRNNGAVSFLFQWKIIHTKEEIKNSSTTRKQLRSLPHTVRFLSSAPGCDFFESIQAKEQSLAQSQSHQQHKPTPQQTTEHFSLKEELLRCCC